MGIWGLLKQSHYVCIYLKISIVKSLRNKIISFSEQPPPEDTVPGALP